MSRERYQLAYIGSEVWESEFAATAKAALLQRRRAHKALPGERRDLEAYAAYCTQIELDARAVVAAGKAKVFEVGPDVDTRPLAPFCSDLATLDTVLARGEETAEVLRGLLSSGGAVIELVESFAAGSRLPTTRVEASASQPSEPWHAPEGIHGVAAVRARWEAQLGAAAGGGAEPLVPSGISNSILTDGFRRFVRATDGPERVEARVVYRDGSEARPFPLRAVATRTDEPEDWTVLKVALMSMRHPEMDFEVDGCWLRNRDVSQVRPASETDEVVYQQSLQQLKELVTDRPISIYLYQTGLEAALVGFYRALTVFMASGRNDIAVTPFYFRSRGGFREGIPWRTM